jgi:hypothetical protein
MIIELYHENMFLRNTISNKNKILFWDNIFFWVRSYTPKGGYAHRAYGVITLIQYVYLLLIISIVVNCLDWETALWIYSNQKNIIFAVGIIFPLLFFANSLIYNDHKYQSLDDKFMQITSGKKKKLKRTFFIVLGITAIIVFIEIKLFHLFEENFIQYP